MIFLLSDFGTDNHYAAAMKAVIASRAAHAPQFDITHNIAPGAIDDAAYELWAIWEYLPESAIVVAVVDPGVGTSRRAVAVRIGGKTVLCPDNGLLTDVLASHQPTAAISLPAPNRTAQMGATFDGRDLFAPSAAALATGAALESLGESIEPSGLVRLDLATPSVVGDTLIAHIRRIDSFGNIITNCQAPLFSDWLQGAHGVGLAIGKGGSLVYTPVRRAYGEAGFGARLVLINSAGLLEIAAPGSSAYAYFDRPKPWTVVRLKRGTR